MKCHECAVDADWVDRNFSPARAYCTEHVVQGAGVHTMNVYDWLEQAGHEVTLVVGLQLGVSTYLCERCGALIKIRDSRVILFHVPPVNATSREDQCYPGDPLPGDRELLRDKLKKLNDEDMERFRKSMED